jgi:hypothetical protein
MHRLVGIVSFSFLLLITGSPGFSQLRSPSEYNRDRINTENTYFVLYDSNEAEFGWASEWTQTTARTYEEKVVLFSWHFKDGSVAYTQQGEHVGDIGMITKYLLTDKSENLKDLHGNSVQPLTLGNFPVKVELWMGTVEDASGFKPELLVDAVCCDSQNIQHGYAYYFYDCSNAAE